MGYTNAKFYCLEHPERTAKDYCNMCNSSMCSYCIDKYEDICPACRREYGIKPDISLDKNSLFFVFLIGVLGLVITYCVLYFKYDDNALSHLFPQGFFFFFLGISAAYTPNIFGDNDSLKILKEVPFFGVKLMLIVIFITIISLVPAVIYLYKVLTFFIQKKK
ncbi:hypothetical protein [uncultured Polaribacter sp.]|uniref:hypothetical protein n=1 Tax=uncultured Polaribacter sp. TaxID=174711 RepID=UPI00259B212A|nr:hypothetical protein [uncultured Polaribacter sp.]